MTDTAFEPAAMTSAMPWHKAPWQQLLDLQASNRLGHAWLISGQQGIGKRRLAVHFARYLLCGKPTDQQPCGTCSGCRLFAVGTHPDFRLVVPEKKLITIEQIRDSLEFAHNTSQRGGMQVLVFDPAEAMNLNAANALLKLLEEPPAHTLLLLISHQPGLLLPTIRSRCQQLHCPLPPQDVALQWLAEQGLAGSTATALHKAGGAPLRALDQDNAETLTQRQVLLDCLLMLPANDLHPVEAAKKCEKISIVATIDYFLLAVADLARTAQTSLPLRDMDLAPLVPALRLKEQPALVSLRLHAMYNSLMKARKIAMASNNANPQLLLESLFAKWSKLGQLHNRQG